MLQSTKLSPQAWSRISFATLATKWQVTWRPSLAPPPLFSAGSAPLPTICACCLHVRGMTVLNRLEGMILFRDASCADGKLQSYPPPPLPAPPEARDAIHGRTTSSMAAARPRLIKAKGRGYITEPTRTQRRPLSSMLSPVLAETKCMEIMHYKRARHLRQVPARTF